MRLSRQNKILEIIKTNEVETQDQLLNLLRNAGYNVTQATVSRDISGTWSSRASTFRTHRTSS